MSGAAKSPPDYRFLIRDFADVLAPENSGDIQNIITNPLPNGAVCLVNSRRALFFLNKFSTLSPNGVDVFAPIAGPGRWLLMTTAVGAGVAVELFSSNPNEFVTDGVLNQPSTDQFSIQEGGNTGAWALTAAGGILTYSGPDTAAIVTLTASVSVDNADALRAILGFVSHNNDQPGFVVGTTVAGVVQVVQTVASQVQMLVAQRFIPALQAGNTLRAKLGCVAGGVGGNIDSMQLIVRAA